MTEKPRIVVLIHHKGSGIVAPTTKVLQSRFNVVEVIHVSLPKYLVFLYLLLAFRPNKKAWHFNWYRLREKIPFSFNALTRVCERHIDRHIGKIDGVVQFGAQFSLGAHLGTIPYFVISDSTRALSSSNPDDKISTFKKNSHAEQWFHWEGDIYRNASGLIARSTRVARSFIDHYGAQSANILTRNFGVGINHSDGNFVKNYDGKTVLCVAKGDFAAKGGKVLLEAFARVLKSVPDAQLIIVGQLGADSSNIRYLGLIEDRLQLRTLFEQAHIYVLPSLIERFGMTLLEAMAAYTPCIVAAHGAMPEIIGDTGYAVARNDVEALAARMRQLLQSSSLASELGRRARERFEKELSWEAVGKDIEVFIRARIHKAQSARLRAPSHGVVARKPVDRVV